MRFLKALFWLIAGMLLAVLAYNNWYSIDVKLGDVIVGVRMPLLVLTAFLLGFLPTFLILRGRIWALKRRLNEQATMHVANTPAGGVRRAPGPAPETERVATDSKVWPTG